MSSYFVNPLFSKYKSADSLRPNYYECAGFTQDIGSRPTVVYGAGAGATFQHPGQLPEFYHHGTSSLSHAPYQQNPCTVPFHADPTGNLYGQDALQSFFGNPNQDLNPFGDSNLKASGVGEDSDSTDQGSSQLFPWMRPQCEFVQDLTSSVKHH